MRLSSTYLWIIVKLINMISGRAEEWNPVGPELCKELCCNINGIMNCGYSVSELRCEVNEDGHKKMDTKLKTFNITKECLSEARFRGRCKRSWKILSTKTKDLQCISPKRMRNHSIRKKKYRRLIMADVNSNRLITFTQLNLTTLVPTEYRYLNSNLVIQIVYLQRLNKLIIAEGVPTKIIMCTLDTYGSIPLLSHLKGFRITALAADDVRIELYFATLKKRIYRKRIFFNEKRIVTVKTADRITSIAVDSSKRNLFVASGNKLFLVFILMKKVSLFDSSKWGKFPLVNFENDERQLYFTNNRNLMLISCPYKKKSQRNSKRILSVKPTVFAIEKTRLYASYLAAKSRWLIVFNVKGGVKYIDMSKFFEHKFTFCLAH